MSACHIIFLIVQRVRAQLTVARLAHPDRLQDSQTRDFRLEATALVAENLATVATMMLSLIECKSVINFDNRVKYVSYGEHINE